MRHRLGARSNVANEPVALVWNPHATLPVKLTQIGYQNAATGTGTAALMIQRATARGTPTSSVTAAIANDEEGEVAAESGLIIDDTATATPPTLVTPTLFSQNFTVAAATAIIIPFPFGFFLPPGTGLGLIFGAAATMASAEVFIRWEE